MLRVKRLVETPQEVGGGHKSAGTVVIYNKGSKSQNEDSVLLVEISSNDYSRCTHRFLLAVADGVGGAQKGEEASRVCTDAIARIVAPKLGVSNVGFPELLAEGFHEANRTLAAAKEKARMASTLTACVVDTAKLDLVHVGDSRAYVIRGDQVYRLTKDHNEEGASNVLMRWVGQENLQVDQGSWELQKNDIVTVCSDGLSKFVSDDEVKIALNSEGLDKGSQRLLGLARSRGSNDDISIAACVVS